eukprot:2412567-Alexandrium_andersonii.AAC.1
MAKDCADCDWRIGGLEPASWRFRDLGPPSIRTFVGGFGSCAENSADCTPRELRRPISRPFLGPRSS